MTSSSRKTSVREIVAFIGLSSKVSIVGSLDRNIGRLHALDAPIGGGLTFCTKSDEEALPLLVASKALAIICRDDGNYKMIPDKTLIQVDNPRLWFIRVARRFFPPDRQPRIHPTAILNGSHVELGKNVRIGPGCTIGFDGFGYEKNENGEYELFPHYGKVIIGDDVEIGANVNIDRGTLEDTVIGSGTKIDSLAHIAHNAQIGENCIIVCLTCIAGGVKIGANSWVAPLAGIRQELEIGEGSTVGMGAIVIRDVPPNDIVAGVPAKSLKRGKEDDR